MRKWVLRSLGLTLVIALFLFGATSVMAAGSEGPTPAGAADIEIDVQETGDWVLKLGTLDLGLSSSNVSSLANRFALALPPLAIDPAMIGLASNSGIQHLAIVKEGNESTIFINGIPATEVALSDAAVSKVAMEFVPELEGLISWANSANLAVVLNFPENGAGERYVLDLGQAVAAAAPAETRANQIGLGATITPDGKIVSIGGIAPADLGLDLGAIDMSFMSSFAVDRLGLNQLDLAVDANGLSVSSNGDEWVSIAWDAEYVAQNAGALGEMGGFVIDQSMVDLAVSWLKDTEIHVGAYLAEDSAEGAPMVSIGRPVSVNIQDKALFVEGFNTGFALDDATLGLIEPLGSMAMVWDGAANQARMAIGDKMLPAIELEEGFLTSVASTFVGDILPWGLVEQILGDTRLTAQLLYEDSAPADISVIGAPAEYRSAAAPLLVDVILGRADGKVAVAGEAVPLAALGVDVSSVVEFLGVTLGPIETVSIDLGPTGLALGLDDKEVRVVWDEATRANVVGLALDFAGKQYGLTALSTPGLVRWAAESAIVMINQFEVGLRIGFTDEPIPAGSIEQLVDLFF